MFLLDLESGTIEAYPVGMMGRNTIMPYDFMDVIIVEEVLISMKTKGVKDHTLCNYRLKESCFHFLIL